MSKKFEKGKMVPVPSHAIIPERDIDKSPILECSHLGIDFGGLRAVNDFNLTIGRTEIAGLIGPNGAGKFYDRHQTQVLKFYHIPRKITCL